MNDEEVSEYLELIEKLRKEKKGNPTDLDGYKQILIEDRKLHPSNLNYLKKLDGQIESKQDQSKQHLSHESTEEVQYISDHLEPDEKVLEVATQSRFVPGGAFTTPNTIFATNKKIIIRNPTMLGMRENIEEIPYDQITSVKLEKGMFSSTIVIRSPGLSELSRLSSQSGLLAWGRGEDGAIDALPSDKAERILKIIKNGMAEARKRKEHPTTVNQQLSVADELGKLAKLKEQGVLTEEEFAKMKNDLINKK